MNQQTAVCPKCGGEYNHPVQLEVNPYGPEGRERILVSSKQVKVERYHEPTVRGVIIRILFLCENGHIWENRVSFHKGQTYMQNHFVSYDTDSEVEMGTNWRH